MRHGIVYDMPAREYHSIRAMSASGIRSLLRSPAHYFESITAERKQTDAMLLGELVHMGVLEPQRFKDKLYVWEKPEGSRTSAADKKARDEEHASAALAGNIVVERSMFATAIRVIHAICSHSKASALLDGAKTEASYFWQDPQFDIPCKSRLDAICCGKYDGVIVDVKTTKDASPTEFAKSAANFCYHAQAAMYWTAHEVCASKSPQAFCWIAAETEPPYGVAVYAIEQPALLIGRALMNRAMERYRDASTLGKWHQYPDEVRVLRFPKWALIDSFEP